MTETIAQLAHECWRLAMHEQGWRHGPAWDGARKVHDALVPFADLKPLDRRTAMCIVESEALQALLGSLIEYPRGADRPFEPGELWPGLPVLLADGGGGRRCLGQVTGWSLEPDGLVGIIEVRWHDGSTSSHHSLDRELQRPGPRPRERGAGQGE